MKEKTLKVTLVGEAGVGKSSILERLSKDRFNANTSSTIGGAFRSFLKGGYRFQMWDTAGQERYQSLIPMYLKGSKIVLMVYDITDSRSYEAIKDHWIDFTYENAKESVYILIGNKTDFDNNRTVDKSQAKHLASINGAEYVEVSAKNGSGFIELIDVLIRAAIVAPEEEKTPINIIRLDGGNNSVFENIKDGCMDIGFNKCVIS
jgi:Ras-related protein Rab-5C